jgi:hypothetical protein
MVTRRSVRVAGVGSVLVALVLLAAPLAAQVAVPFPSPVVAPVEGGAAADPAGIVAFYRDPEVPVAEPILIVQLARPIAEQADGTRISVLTGDPNGVQRRSSLLVEAGGVRGEVEEGDAAGFAPLEGAAPPQVEVTAEGFARIGIEPSGETDLVWVETETPDGTRAISPVFPLSQVIEAAGPGALTPATVASVFDADNNPTGEIVELTAVPTLEVLNQGITVRTTQPIPTEVGGVAVSEVRDFLRLAPDFSVAGEAPYFVYIDYLAGAVTYLDSSGGIPVVVDVPEESWLIDGLTAEDDETASVTLDRAGLLEGAGLPPDGDVGIGVSRAVVLEDGRYLTAEGPLAELSWFEQGTVDEVPTETTASLPPTTAVVPTVTIAEESTDDGGPNGVVVIVAAVIALVLAGVALYASRQNRKALGDPDMALGAMAKVVDKTAHEQPEGESVTEPASRRPSAPSGVRVPATRDPAVADAVGVKGARAAVSREAQARAAARDRAERGESSEPGEPDGANGDAGGRDALWAAMRKKAAESERAQGGTATDDGAGDADDGEDDAPRRDDGDGDGDGKSTSPDDALDALNRFIEDLRLPGET